MSKPNPDRILLLHDARFKIEEAIEEITEALAGTSHELHAAAYLVSHLKNWMGGEGSNPYDTGISDYIRELDASGEE